MVFYIPDILHDRFTITLASFPAIYSQDPKFLKSLIPDSILKISSWKLSEPIFLSLSPQNLSRLDFLHFPASHQQLHKSLSSHKDAHRVLTIPPPFQHFISNIPYSYLHQFPSQTPDPTLLSFLSP
jgi:hypothetical protein